MAGFDGYTSVNTTARQQWVGFGDSPQTISASFQTRLLQRSYRIVNNPVRRTDNMLLPSTKGRVGLGAYLINDANGNVARTGVQFTYAYHLIFNNHQLSFGLAAKAFQFRIAQDNLTFGKDLDPLSTTGIIGVGYLPDVDVGIYFTNTNYYAGFSASNLFQSVLKIGGATNNYQILRHYWLMGGYKFRINTVLELEPHMLFKTTEQLLPQFDLGVKAYFNEDYWGGFTYRTDGSLIFLFGVRMDGLFLGYSMDYSLSPIQRFSYGSHELSLSYKFGDNARRYRWLRRY